MYGRRSQKFLPYVKITTIKCIVEKWNQQIVQKNPLLKEAYGPLTLKNGWFDVSLRMTP